MAKKGGKARKAAATTPAPADIEPVQQPQHRDLDVAWMEEHLPTAAREGEAFTVKVATHFGSTHPNSGHVVARLRDVGRQMGRPNPAYYFDADGEDITVVLANGTEHTLNLAALNVLSSCRFMLAAGGAVLYGASCARVAHDLGELEFLPNNEQ